MLSSSSNFYFLLLFLSFLFLNLVDCEEKVDEEGLGSHYHWKSWREALDFGKKSKKPLMVILTKSWCSACKALKPKFASSDEIFALSKRFVMVKAQEGEEPSDLSLLQPGGAAYIPRILFLDHHGNLMSQFMNRNGNPKYQYFYYDVHDIATTMKNVIEYYSHHHDVLEQLEEEQREKIEL